MSEVPVEVVVAAFQDEKSADAALKELKQLSKQKLIKIENAAVLRKDENGKLHIKETADMGGGKGAALGGVAGAAVGLIAGPALIVPVAVGALVGGLVAKARDAGFSDERLKKLGEGLTPGSSAIVAVVDHTWVETLEKQMQEAGADLMTEQLQADIASQLEAGHDVAYTALASQAGYATSRVSAGEDDVEGSEMVVTDEGVYASEYVATKDGFAVRSLTATDEATLVEGAVVTEKGATYAGALATDEGVIAVAAEATPEEGDEEEDEQES